MKVVFFLAFVVALAYGYRPLRPYIPRNTPVPSQIDVGDPLYLTDYIDLGDIATARTLAKINDPLNGMNGPLVGQPNEMYSGFFTVNKTTNSNMFFWFTPAMDVDPLTAPVVIWLQGGPGGSSMFGLLELHGPIHALFDGEGATGGVLNPYTWASRANMLYIDNPVGAGYSYADAAGLPTDQARVAEDLYECLQQFYTVFYEYQSTPFYAFGESYGGKFVPTIALKILAENPTATIPINLAGIGIGDGFMSPPETALYADYLYEASLVDEVLRTELLDIEQTMIDHTLNDEWALAWASWSNEFSVFLGSMGCEHYYDITRCENDPETDNYADYMTLPETRKAVHAGDLPFGQQSGDVYTSMRQDFMRPQRMDIEQLLDQIPVLIYDGNLDIICNHLGVLNMFHNMETWTGKPEYDVTERTVFRHNGDTVGYLKSVQNLRMLVMRNAGHMVPRDQPMYSQDMFNQFISGTL